MLLYPIFFKKEIRHTHFFPLFPLFPLNRYISLRFIFFSRHHDMQRLFLIFDDDFCVPAAEFAVQRPRDLFLCLHLQPGGLKAIHLRRVDIALRQGSKRLIEFVQAAKPLRASPQTFRRLNPHIFR